MSVDSSLAPSQSQCQNFSQSPKVWGRGKGSYMWSRHFEEMDRKRSALVPVVKDMVGIIFPRSQKALDGFGKPLLVLGSLDESTLCVSCVKSPAGGAEPGRTITSNLLGPQVQRLQSVVHRAKCEWPASYANKAEAHTRW